MVGGRRQALETHTLLYTNAYDSKQKSNGYVRNDLEAAYGSINHPKSRMRFRDAVQDTIRTNRTAEMKKKLIDNVDHEALEKYRKSEESVRRQIGAFCDATTNSNRIAQNHQEQESS